MVDLRKWQHVFKLDPNKGISDRDLKKICESGTDAIIIGGTDGITMENTLRLSERVQEFNVFSALEVSSLDAIVPGFDLYLIPTVLNSKSPQWILGQHMKAIKEFGFFIDWEKILIEGYCVLNEDSKVAKLTEANVDLDEDDVAALATVAEKMFHLPIFYLEYSGIYGNPDVVKNAKRNLDETILFYGGGINSVEKAKEMKQFADVLVVGNLIYENVEEALKTVEAIKG